MAIFNRSTVAAIVLAMIGLCQAGPTLAEPASSSALQDRPAGQFHDGDLVHVRSGGPLMSILRIHGDQADCSWTDWDGDLRSGSFPVTELQGPITIPPPNPQDE